MLASADASSNGAISAAFTTYYNGASHASSTDVVSATGPGSSGITTAFGALSTATNNSYASTVGSGTVFAPGSYNVYGGSCTGDDVSGQSETASAAVSAGNTTSVSVPLPAMIVEVYGQQSTTVDDGPSSAVVYTGSGWTHGATGNQNYDSTESFSNTSGNYVSFTFTGTSVSWIAPKSNNSGYANVYLDGTLVASNVTAYASTTSYQQTIWSVSGLANSIHTLKIVVDGTKPSASTNTYVPVDAFIYSQPALLTSAPVVTLTDNNTGCNNTLHYPPTQTPTATQGALADPGQPYGNFTVCASSGGVKNTATVSNTSYTSGNVVNVYLGAGSSGLTSGSCTSSGGNSAPVN
jgi:hypothetical protein